MKPKYRTWIGKYLLISVAAIVILSALVLWGYTGTWTGFGDFTKPDGEFVRGKTLWDWMQLFIIPIFLSIGLFLLNRSERNSEREIATDRQHEMALQSYLDRMADLLLKEKLLTTESEEVQKVARIRTLTALRGLDGKRKGLIVRFLYEADLIYKEKTIIGLEGADLQDAELQGVNLQNANLCFANLRRVDLQDAYLKDVGLQGAHLEDARLRGAQLEGADLMAAFLQHADLCANLQDANLQNADLQSTNLKGAHLKRANLQGADLKEANLENIHLNDAKLEDANLQGAILQNAELGGATLQRANVTMKQLKSAKTVQGAILPDGTKHD